MRQRKGKQMLKLFSRLLDHRIEAYQRELIETHYKEVDNMYRQMRGWRHDYRGHIHEGPGGAGGSGRHPGLP